MAMINVLYDWSAIVIIFTDVVTLEIEHRLLEIIASEVVLVPQLLKVGGETFIQPAIGPVPAGHKITKPLVCQLMRHDGYIVEIQGSSFIEQQQKAVRGSSGMLHCAGKQPDDCLGVLAIGLLDAAIS